MKWDAGELEIWSPDLFPYDQRGRDGTCRFAPTCGGVAYGDGKQTRPDHEGCPDNPAEFAEHLGMDDAAASGTAARPRYMAICRPRAERRFGKRAVRLTEQAAEAGT